MSQIVSKPITIIGEDDTWQEISNIWRMEHPDRQINTLELKALDEMLATEALSPSETNVFVAMGCQDLNVSRFDILNRLMLKGFQAESFISRVAIVSEDVKIRPNTYIAPGAIVVKGCIIGMNSFINVKAHLAERVKLGASTWIGRYAIVDRQVKIGAYATLSAYTQVEANIEIGSFSVVETPRRVEEDIPKKTFWLKSFQNPVQIIDFAVEV